MVSYSLFWVIFASMKLQGAKCVHKKSKHFVGLLLLLLLGGGVVLVWLVGWFVPGRLS